MDKNTETIPSQTQVALARAVTQIRALKAQLNKTIPEPIAIVGAAGRFPGAPNLESFWTLCQTGGCAIDEIPASRFDTQGIPARAGLLDEVDGFDHAFFGLSPAEARMMDPQHRMLLETAWDALDASCIDPAKHADAAGMFVGIMNSDYREFALQEADTYTGTGNTACFSSGRISHLLGLHGPSLCLDTACSSSLVTVHLACQSLRSGEIDLALAGGCSLILSRNVMELTKRTGALSATGRAHIFDERANGYVRGEGCGIVVLKRLKDALRDGDQIWAVIKGSAVNHDGRSSTLTAPSPDVQERVVRQALEHANVRAEDVGYIEAHGTGTSIGDPIELDGLARVLGMAQGCHGRCYIGSGKANIGHLEAAAGVTGLLRAVGALRTKTIFPQVNFEHLNSRISLRGTTLSIPTKHRPWPSDAPRIAGVSAFGMSGTNAHVILEEAPAIEASTQSGLYDDLLMISAQSPQALDALIDAWEALAKTHDWHALARAAASRPLLEHRRIIQNPNQSSFARARSRTTTVKASPRIVVCFGEEHTYDQTSMAELLEHCQSSKHTYDTACAHMKTTYEFDVTSKTSAGQMALALIQQLATAAHLQTLGISDVEVIGIGTGTIAAGVHAGAWSIEDACNAITTLARTHALALPKAQTPTFEFTHVFDSKDGALQGMFEGADIILGIGAMSLSTFELSEPNTRLDAITQLAETGALTKWSHIVKPQSRGIQPPAYPWQRQSHWVGAPPRPFRVEDWCYDLTWRAVVPAQNPTQRKTILAFADQSAASKNVLDHLKKRAETVITVSEGDHFSLDMDNSQATIRASSGEDLRNLHERVNQSSRNSTDHIVVLPTFGPNDGSARRALAINLAQNLSIAIPRWFVTREALTPNSAQSIRVEAPLWGLLRAHFFETNTSGGLLDIANEGAHTQYNWLDAMFTGAPKPAQLRVTKNGVEQAIITPASIETSKHFEMDAHGCYLVTGGTGGIGRRFVDRLIQRGARHIYVTSRREPNKQVAKWIEEAKGKHVTITWLQADVSNQAQVQMVFDEISKGGKTLRGIGHAAGVGSQTDVQHLTEAEYRRVCAAKIDGGWLLHEMSKDAHLDFFLAFSSIASILAGRGQAAYSAANNGLDALISYRRRQGLVGTSVRWGLWDGEGIPDEKERAQIEALGLSAMKGERALDVLDKVLMTDLTMPIVASVRWQTCLSLLDPGQNDPMFSALRLPAAPVTPSSKANQTRTKAQSRELILTHIARHIDMPPSAVPLDRSLSHIGLDSLGAYALKGQLQDAGIILPMEVFIDGSTIEDLIEIAASGTTLEPAPAVEHMATTQPVESEPQESQKQPKAKWSNLAPSGIDRGWFVQQTTSPLAKHRLICFPYAGGSPTVFAGWANELPEEVELRSVQLPARAARLNEEPVQRMNHLVDALIDAYAQLEPMPTAFFGHCFGALMMFELTRRMRTKGMTLPTHFFVSGARSPHSYTRDQLLADVEQFSPSPPLQLPQLDDDTLVEALTEMRFADTVEALHQPELRQLLLPAVRADFEMSNNYLYEPTQPLPIPIFAMGGRADGYVTALQLLSWREHTTVDFGHEYCSGGHYFIADNTTRWIERITTRLFEST